MPTYRKGTRQWAEQRMAQLTQIGIDTNKWHETMDEWAELNELIHAGTLPEGVPTYSKAELEEMGQGTMFAEEIA